MKQYERSVRARQSIGLIVGLKIKSSWIVNIRRRWTIHGDTNTHITPRTH